MEWREKGLLRAQGMKCWEYATGKPKKQGGKRNRTAYMAAYRPLVQRAPLSQYQILVWADAHHARTGCWPTVFSGRIPEANHENWNAISSALRQGYRGLPGGCTLVQLLARARGVRNKKKPPPLCVREIVKWAHAHRARHAKWPLRTSGTIPDTGGETWACVDRALRLGMRDLAGGTSLSKFLAAQREILNAERPPKLCVAQVLTWADEYFAVHGRWPDSHSGAIPGSRGERWRRVDLNLKCGSRGLPGSTSLAELLEGRRKPGNPERARSPGNCAKRAIDDGLPASATSRTWP